MPIQDRDIERLPAAVSRMIPPIKSTLTFAGVFLVINAFVLSILCLAHAGLPKYIIAWAILVMVLSLIVMIYLTIIAFRKSNRKETASST